MAGKYKTRQQAAIKQCLEMNKDRYITVNEIEKYLKEHNCSVGLTTIYRHLEKMEEDGIVTRLNVEGSGGTCFQYVENGDEDCFYIQCEVCGQITKMACRHLAELYSHVSDEHHFTVNPNRTVFFGICEKCSK